MAVSPQHEVLSASEEGPAQQEDSVGGADAPWVSAIVPYRARTAVRISSWVSVSIPSSPLVVMVLSTSIPSQSVIGLLLRMARGAAPSHNSVPYRMTLATVK